MNTVSRLAALGLAFASAAALAQTTPHYEFRAARKGLQVSTTPGSGSNPGSDTPPPKPPVTTYIAQLSTPALSFEAAVGASLVKQVLLSNEGTGTLTLAAPQVSGAAFSASTTCGETLAPGGSCQTDVTFSPTAMGAASGTVVFGSNATAGNLELTLTGTGKLAQGEVTALTDTGFGTVAVGSTASRTFTYTNTGNVTLTEVNAVTTGSALSFTSNTCGTAASPVSLAAGASCSMTLRYAPTTAGLLQPASLKVVSSEVPAPTPTSLYGVAVWPASALDLNFASGPANLVNGALLSTVGSVTAGAGYATGFADTSYFSGSSATANLALTSSTDFTLEGWFYMTSQPAASGSGSYFTILRGDNSTSLDAGFTRTGFKMALQPGTSPKTFAFTPPVNGWFHFAVVRSAGMSTAYLDGTPVGSAVADTNAYNSATAFRVGANSAGLSMYFHGHIGSVKLTKTALYTGAFTPVGRPSAP